MKKESSRAESNKFKIVLSFIIIFTILSLIFQDFLIVLVDDIVNVIFKYVHYIFFDTVNLIIIILLIIGFSKKGKIRLGGIDAKTKYSNFSWYAMLFSAGMGIGIIFYSVSEPISHLYDNPLFNSTNNPASSLATTYFSWGIHAWAVYAMIGLVLAYIAYNKNLPLSFKSLFYPLLKDKIYKWPGDIIDSIAIIITLFALSSSLGMGTLQINAGLSYVFGISYSLLVQVLIIIVVMIFVLISVLSGVGKGVRIFSENNIRLSIVLAIVLLFAGPTLLLIKLVFTSSFIYLKGLIPAMVQINSVDIAWSSSWSIFCMTWWISWSIFVGIFIAKISYGRTIREFIFSIILIPTIISVIWFSILGGNAMYLDITDSSLNFANLVNTDTSISLFVMIDNLIDLPIISILMQVLSLAIIFSFFITSADSGAIVVSEMAINKEEISSRKKIFWTLIQGVLTIVLLIAGGSLILNYIQQILVIVSLPMIIILLYLSFLLIYLLYNDKA